MHFGEERIELIQPLELGVHQLLTEHIQRTTSERGADEGAGGVLGGEHLPKRRGDAHPPFAVERTSIRRNETLVGHAPCPRKSLEVLIFSSRYSPKTRISAPFPPYGTVWDSMGYYSESRKCVEL